MSELYAIVDFAVELYKFHNVDLFQRGLYQLRVTLTTSPKVLKRIDLFVPRRIGPLEKDDSSVFPHYKWKSIGVTKTFQILYRNDEILLDEVFVFRATILVDSNKIEESLERASFTLHLGLCFSETPSENPSFLRCVSVRTLRLSFATARGLHDHLPVIFDYRHLSAVTLTVHAALLSLRQPHIKKNILHYVQSCAPRGNKPFLGSQKLQSLQSQLKLDNALFGNINPGSSAGSAAGSSTSVPSSASSTKCGPGSNSGRVALARHLHQEVCTLILAAYECLHSKAAKYFALLDVDETLPAELTNWEARFLNLSDIAKECHPALAATGSQSGLLHGVQSNGQRDQGIDSEEELVEIANKDIALLWIESLSLWRWFIDTFTLKEPIQQHLGALHHNLRVRRFAEAFFVSGNPRQSAAGCFDTNYQTYLAVSEMVRKSRYLQALPHLPVHCIETDGDLCSLPIIFEDHYQEIDAFVARLRGVGRDTEDGRSATANLVHGDCSCGISAILESRALKSCRPSVANKLVVEKPTDEETAVEVIKGTLTLGGNRLLPIQPSQPASRTATLPARHSKSMEQLRSLQGFQHHQTLPTRRPPAAAPPVVPLLSLPPKAPTPVPRRAGAEVPVSKSSDCLEKETASLPPPPANFRHRPRHQRFRKILLKEAPPASVSSSSSGDSLSASAFRRLESSASAPYDLSIQGGRAAAAANLAARSTVSLPAQLSRLQLEDLGFLSEVGGSRWRRPPTSSESMPNLRGTPPLNLPIPVYFSPTPTHTPTPTPTPSRARVTANGLPTALPLLMPDTLIGDGTGITPQSQSPCNSSASGEVTSEQSGWVSHSSRRSSIEASSGQLSPDNTGDVPSANTRNSRRQQVVNGVVLCSRLKVLAAENDQVPPPTAFSILPDVAHVPDLVIKSSFPATAIPFPDLVSGDSHVQWSTPALLEDTCDPPSPAPSPLPRVLDGEELQLPPPSPLPRVLDGEELQLPPPSQFSDMQIPPPPPVPSSDNHLTPLPPEPFRDETPFPIAPVPTISLNGCGKDARLINHRHRGRSKKPTAAPLDNRDPISVLWRSMSTRKETDSPASPDETLDAVDNPLYHRMESLNCKPWPRRRQTSHEHLSKPADVSQISLSTSPLQASPPHSSSSSNGFSSASTAELNATGPHLAVNQNASDQDLNFVENKIPPQPMPRSSPNEDKSKTVPTPAARPSHQQQQQKQKQTKHLVKTRSAEPEEEEITFAKAKEEFKRSMNFSGMIYSDFPNLASTLPYFHVSESYRFLSPAGLHLVVCVHGLCGTSNDLRLVKAFLELGLPGSNLEFIMSDRNSCDTQADFDTMADRLVLEIVQYIEVLGLEPTRISFVGHSLGNVIIRAALSKPLMKPYQERFHTFLSLAGPHLGTLYNSSGLVNMGVWLLSRMKGSDSIVQLSCRDAADLRKTFMYRLSQTSCLHKFKNVLLCGSSQDRYVPFHSARIELCKAAVKDQTPQGVAYREMVHNILHPIIMNTNVTFVRYDVHHCFNSHSADSLLGRAAHVAVLDSGKFLEKFLMVVGLKYFR